MFGLGFGMVTQVLIVAVQNSVERRELGVATATTGFFRALGGAVGAAVLGAVSPPRASRDGAHATSSTPSRRSSWSPRRSPRWLCWSAVAARDPPADDVRPRPEGGEPMTPRTPFETTVLLRSEESGGAVSMIENRVPAGWEGPPLHHHEFDEAFYVLEGELTFQLGDELGHRVRGPVGVRAAAACITRWPTGATPRRATCWSARPAGFERYFDRIAAEAAGVDPPASALEPYPETTVVGPTIGERRTWPRPRRSRPCRGGSGCCFEAATATAGSR